MRNLQVIKIGTNSGMKNGELDFWRIYKIGYNLAAMKDKQSTDTVLVVSGAIGMGMSVMGLEERPSDSRELQGCARVGQTKLIEGYGAILTDGFRWYEGDQNREFGGVVCSQYLVTYHNLDNRPELRNIADAIRYDLTQGVLPIVNYNDGIDPSEVTRDNDTLAARLTKAILAERLVILTDVDGLLDGDGELVEQVSEVDSHVLDLCTAGNGTGGMVTKLEAAKLLLIDGTPTYIANVDASLVDIVSGEAKSTLIV